MCDFTQYSVSRYTAGCLDNSRNVFNTVGVLLIQVQEVSFQNIGLKNKWACNWKKNNNC